MSKRFIRVLLVLNKIVNETLEQSNCVPKTVINKNEEIDGCAVK